MTFDSFGASPLGERIGSPLGVFDKGGSVQAHLGTSTANEFGAFAQDSSGVYIATGASGFIDRLVETDSGLSAITRTSQFMTTGGTQSVTTVLADATYIYVIGVADIAGTSVSVWRFEKSSFAQRFKDFEAGGIVVQDALMHGSSLLLLVHDNAETRILILDNNLILTGRHLYTPTTGLLYGGSIILRPSASSYVFVAGRTSTVLAYVELDSTTFAVISSHTITFTGSTGLHKAVLLGDVLVILSSVAFSADRVISAVNVSTHTFLWGKRFENDSTPGIGINSISADAGSVYGVGDYKQSGLPTSMAVVQLSIIDGATQKSNRMRSHLAGAGALRKAMIVGSDLWLGGDQNTEQQNEITITAFDVLTTYSVTIGLTTVSQIGVTDANTTATNLKNACDASADAGFAALTWSVLTNVVRVYGPVSFTISVSVAGGTGAISNQQITSDNTFGSTDLQIFKTSTITDSGLTMTITGITGTISTITVTKSTPADTSGTAVNSTGTTVAGYQIAPSTFTI